MWWKKEGTKESEHLMLKVRDESNEMIRVFWFWHLGFFRKGKDERLGFVLGC